MARTAELQAANAKLEALSLSDGLTGLLNRRAMAAKLEELHDLSRRYGNAYSVILLDIDHFKQYNDTLGHLAGDEAIRRIAKRLRSAIRGSDHAYRYGGEEFLVAMPPRRSRSPIPPPAPPPSSRSRSATPRSAPAPLARLTTGRTWSGAQTVRSTAPSSWGGTASRRRRSGPKRGTESGILPTLAARDTGTLARLVATPQGSAHAPHRGATDFVITVALSANIGAPRERVWRALVDPEERTAWDERILGEVALSRTSGMQRAARRPGVSAESRRTPIRSSRYRFRLAGVPLVLRDEILTADRRDRLVSRISIGSFHFDQTLTLYDEDNETGPLTRLGLKIVAANSIPVIGESLPRLDVQKLVIEYADTTLRQVRKHCEAGA